MGLDISAYRRLKVAGYAPVDEDGYPKWDMHVRLQTEGTERNWPGRSAPLAADGVYDWFGKIRFCAGSYGGYNNWRDILAKFAGHGSPREVWDDPKPGPFVELINFSDCDGVIGSVVAAKLAKDFAEHRSRADQHENEYFRALYRDFQEAFEFASDNGAVEFH